MKAPEYFYAGFLKEHERHLKMQWTDPDCKAIADSCFDAASARETDAHNRTILREAAQATGARFSPRVTELMDAAEGSGPDEGGPTAITS